MTPKTPTSTVATDSATACTSARDATGFLITVTGDLDVAAVEGAALNSALSRYRSDEPVDVVLDLDAVTYLDSAGLSWLLAVRSAASLASRRVRLRRSSPFVDDVLERTQLKRYFPNEPRPI